MYVRPDELRRNLEAVDSETLHAQLQSGALTKDAVPIALGILASRGFQPGAASPDDAAAAATVAQPMPPPRQSSRTAAKVLLGCYILFMALCTGMVFLDPPWVKPGDGSWAGMAGLIASELAGFPWSILALFALVNRVSDAQAVAVNYGGVLLNLVIFAIWIHRA